MRGYAQLNIALAMRAGVDGAPSSRSGGKGVPSPAHLGSFPAPSSTASCPPPRPLPCSRVSRDGNESIVSLSNFTRGWVIREGVQAYSLYVYCRFKPILLKIRRELHLRRTQVDSNCNPLPISRQQLAWCASRRSAYPAKPNARREFLCVLCHFPTSVRVLLLHPL